MTQQIDPGILMNLPGRTSADCTSDAISGSSRSGTSQASSGSGAQPGAKHVDWPKLSNKLSTFGEGKTIETDVKGWRDYQWQLQQYLVAMNDGYDSEFHQFTRNPNAALDMRRRTATEATICIPCLPV